MIKNNCNHTSIVVTSHSAAKADMPAPADIKVLTQSVLNTASELSSLKFPWCGVKFQPRMDVNKLELHCSLLFPLDASAGSTRLLLAPTLVAQSMLEGSIIFDAIAQKGTLADDPACWNRDFIRLSDRPVVLAPRQSVKLFAEDDLPVLPGEFAPFWPSAGWKNGQKQLPLPLHTCRALYLDCVRGYEEAQNEASVPGHQELHSFMRVTYVIEIDATRALAHHLELLREEPEAEQRLEVFFPNASLYGEELALEDMGVAHSMTDVLLALFGSFESVMQVSYADLRQAMAKIPQLPLLDPLPLDWSDVEFVGRIAGLDMEVPVSSNLDAKAVYAELMWNILALSVKDTPLQRSADGLVADARWSEFFNESCKASFLLHAGRKNAAEADEKMTLRVTGEHSLALGLRLRGRDALCRCMPRISKTEATRPTLALGGEAYSMLSRTNVATGSVELLETILWVLLTSHKRFKMFMDFMETMPNDSSDAEAWKICRWSLLFPAPAYQAAIKHLAHLEATGAPILFDSKMPKECWDIEMTLNGLLLDDEQETDGPLDADA